MTTKAPTYDWRCRNCEAVNVAHTSVCSACGFDTLHCYPPSLWEQMGSAGVPPWRRVIVLLFGGVGAVVGFIGLLFFVRVYLPFDLTGMVWSGAAALVGGGLLWIAYKMYPEDQ